MRHRPDIRLSLLPGERQVLFIVQMEQATSVLAATPPRFLEGLRAACDLLSFSGLLRSEDMLDELLPWAGGV